ncbi:hypothetical protein ACLB2K_035077 [Fragaria x ananassa]
MDEADREHPEVNRYLYTYEKAYPDAQEDIAKVREASDEVMSAIARETWLDTQDEEMSEAMSRIDTLDLTIGVRIMGTAFPPRANNFYCRGLGKKGKGVLKDHSRISTKGSLDQQQDHVHDHQDDSARVGSSETTRTASCSGCL